MPEADLAAVQKAYDFAVEAHREQTRMSGESFVSHPLATAKTLAELHLDVDAIVAALLHDVPEDTEVTIEGIREIFGDEVATLVDGVTKLTRIEWLAAEENRVAIRPKGEDLNVWAENLRKMFLAMAEDLRVVLIKLADRLHNMRTLSISRRQAPQIAQETMEIYAPLASRLGIWQIKWQLEDLAFPPSGTGEVQRDRRLLASRRETRERYVSRVIGHSAGGAEGVGIKAEVSGRPKHIYSIYRKMQRRGVISARSMTCWPCAS